MRCLRQHNAVSNSYLRRELQLLRILLDLQSQLSSAGSVTCHLLHLLLSVRTNLTHHVNGSFCKYFRVVLSLSLLLLSLFWSVRLWQPAGWPHPGDNSCSVFTPCTLCGILHILVWAKGSCYAVVLLLYHMDFLQFLQLVRYLRVFRCILLPCQDKLHKCPL